MYSLAKANRNLVSLSLALLVAFVILVGMLPRFPAPAAASVAATATPTSEIPNPNSKVGLHTRLTDEPDPAKIEKEFEMLRAMGGSYATEFFPWAYIQPSDRNRFDWAHADEVADAAQRNGIILIARVDSVPAWARPANTTWKYLDREHYADYAAFVAAFVSHFKGRISHYIIWNEPNTAAEWGQRPPDPQAYADLLKAVYPAAKAADPDAVIMLAGLAPNLEHEGSTAALNDLTYLDDVYKAGAKPYFDAVAVHAYGLTASPDDPSAPNKLNYARTEQIYKVMQQYGDGGKFVYITEGGWNDSPRWSYAVKPYQRVEYTVEAYRKAEQDWPWVKAVCLWASRYPAPTHTYFDNYTFLTPDFIPKAVYLEVQKYALAR